MAKEREADLKEPGEEPLKGKERTLGFRHGLTQPKWPKTETNGDCQRPYSPQGEMEIEEGTVTLGFK